MSSKVAAKEPWGGKLPDEMKRRRPKSLVIRQGMHPHPGPTIYDCGFDDTDGGDWASDGRDQSDLSDGEDWREEPLLHRQSMDVDLHANLEEMAWNILMQPPGADMSLRSVLNDMGCPYGVVDMAPDFSQ